ncbi:TonB-dependent receptor [Oleiagrimonas sp. MCCC 1A03011]|uniref:TonB-dependent receptor n=1 Tax=Oleiagrimonas sp. MCCC 1A03011 TaxID=1926883 RepID=UPI001F0C925F|nr:TonB-dependent receptor [Oleiagrimonas sp. MCCC 1A03011]
MKRQILCVAIAAAFAAPLCVQAAQPAVSRDAAPVMQNAPANAQNPKQTEAEKKRAEATQLQTVTVTARRRSENLEKVPVAVSAFSSEDLKDLQANNIDGLQGAVPGLNIVPGRGSSSSVNVFIRGIGQPDALQTFDPGVGMYVDDVYYSRIQGALFDLFDVDHVEVLRGPQGTLYGKNSTGGAIKIITKQPSQTPGGSVEAKVGSFGRREGQFYFTGPLSDTLTGSLAGIYTKSDGFVTDPTTGRKYNNDDTKAVRGKLRWEPSDAFNATLSLDYTKQDTALTLGQPTAPLYATDLLLGPVLLYTPPGGKYDFHSQTSFGPGKGQKLKHRGAALHMNWKLSGDWNLKSITAYRKLDSNSYIDIDASQFQLGDVLVDFHQKQFSQELQLQYDNGDNLEAVYGLYYLNEKVPSHQEAYANDFIQFGGLPIDFLRTIDDDLRNKSYAGFAHVNWTFAPTWTLAAGVRYTKETKKYYRTTSAFFGAPLQAFSADPQAVIDNVSKSWSAVTPSLSLQKQFNPQVMGYISVNRGFKSGGFNGRANDPNEAADPIFNPEYVWTYEMGLKMRSSDNRLQGNLAAYRSNYSDFQARVSDVVNPGSLTPSFDFPVLNAAKLRIQGLEFEGTALMGRGTRLSTQLAWMDATYQKFDDHRLNPSDPLYDPNLHKHVPFSPKFTARVALTQTFELSGGAALTFGADASYRSDTWLSVDNRPGLMQKAYTVTGLFGVYDSANGDWQVRTGVRNLGDKTYKTDAQEFSSVGNIQTAYYAMPRNWYLSARYNF